MRHEPIGARLDEWGSGHHDNPCRPAFLQLGEHPNPKTLKSYKNRQPKEIDRMLRSQQPEARQPSAMQCHHRPIVLRCMLNCPAHSQLYLISVRIEKLAHALQGNEDEHCDACGVQG